MKANLAAVNDSSSPTTPPTFGRWLKRLRGQQDLTQEALAELAYCSVQTIRFFESGKRRPSLEMAERLVEVLSVPPEQQSLFIRMARAALNPSEEEPVGEARTGQSATQATVDTATESVAKVESSAPPSPSSSQSSPAPRLPTPATLMVGRQPEAEHLEQLVARDNQRLVTLMGPGGIGKTRLALHMAHTLEEHFADGALFVPLVSITNSDEFPSAIAAAMNKSLAGDNSNTAQLDTLLTDQRLLLVLDNFEHLLAADGDAITALVDHILQHLPTVHLLITSRERLRLPGECIFELSGLAIPKSTQSSDVATSDAVMLFLQRARQVSSTFALTPANRNAIVRACTLLSGMPLGIELAAAWVRMLTPDEIVAEIERSLDFLTLSDRGVPTRHRSLRAAFEHSWALLSPDEQKAAARLSIFRGGFRREGAYAVAGATLAHLAALIDKSLVQVVPEFIPEFDPRSGEQATPQTGALRYQLHELLRQYLRSKLVEMGDEEAIARRHIEYLTALAEKVDTHQYAELPHAWFQQLRAEQGNLREAMEWSLGGRNAPELGLRLVAGLGRFWFMGDAWKEGRDWLILAIFRISAETPLEVQALILTQLGELEQAMAEYASAKNHLQEALALWRKLDNASRTAWTLFHIGVLHSTIAEFDESEEIFSECLAIYRRLNEPWFVALVLMQLASSYMSKDNFERAAQLLDEAVPIFRAQERTNIVAVALNMQGWVHLQQEDAHTAIEHFKEALAIGQSEGNLQSIGWSLRNLGMGHLRIHALEEAEHYLRQCLRTYQQISFKSGLVIAFEILASVAAEQGKSEVAVQWLAVADNLRKAIGLPRTPGDVRVYYTMPLEMTKAALTPQAWDAAWLKGSQLSPDEAIAHALAG